MINVVAAIIKQDDLIYICKRSESMSLPNLWEFPGGKVELGESNEVALIREIKEELGCEIHNLVYLTENKHDYENFSINLICYTCELKSGTPVSNEHCEEKWVKVSELGSYDFAPADIPVLSHMAG